MKKNTLYKALILSIFFLIALSIIPANIFAKTLDINVSVYPLYDIVDAIVADKANVNLVVPAGTEIHGYEPSPRRIAAIEDTDIFLYIGLGLESWAEKLVGNLESLNVKTIKLSNSIDLLRYEDQEHHHRHGDVGDDHKEESHIHEDNENKHEDNNTHLGHNHGDFDPHIWLDPMNMKEMATVIKDQLITLDNENKEVYQENYQQYIDQLDELDNEFRETLKDVDKEYIMVSHAAFGYMGNRYGFKQLSVTGQSSHAEPSPGNISKLIKEVEAHEIRYIFRETLASPRIVEVLAQEANLDILVLNPLGGLTADEEKRGEDYFSIMRRNLKNLERALVD